ncbi:hypothetical protein [Streptomyces iconiensis]|uniref:Uncharacterized protein n=1 Tax=Streptomyces iconiensis TaxID=1384038 RepID=A0ABT6ZZG9_9ACTN|nr:hypothetical protein [Streptomyces iconiensis]MDJ1134464.1 hypothetical protein [Streptomyces iconiensis]
MRDEPLDMDVGARQDAGADEPMGVDVREREGWQLCAVRLLSARALLHDASVPVALWRQRERYALLVAVTRALGRCARAASPRWCLPIHATPGHSVPMYHRSAAPHVEAAVEAARAWLADLGLDTEVRRAPATAGLDAASWPLFVAAWHDVQRDHGPKAALRTGFADRAPASLDTVRDTLAAATGPGRTPAPWPSPAPGAARAPATAPACGSAPGSASGAWPMARLVAEELRRVLRAWRRAEVPAFLAHMPVGELLAGNVVPGGLAVARLDVSGFRAGLVRGAASGRQLLNRGALLGGWFLGEVPRLVASVNRGRPAACRAGVLLSVCDDVVLVGSAPTLAAARRALAGAWAAHDVGELCAGTSPPGSGTTLSALSRAALADLSARTDDGRPHG